MSIRASKWVWGKQLSQTLKLILLALADTADSQGVCWPRIKIIAAMCCVSVRTVQRKLKELEEGGFLTVAYRYCGTGRQMSSVYTLRLDNQSIELKLCEQIKRDVVGDDLLTGTGAAHVGRGGGDVGLSCQQPLQEPLFEPKHDYGLPNGLSGEDVRSITHMLNQLLESDARHIAFLLEKAFRGRKIRGAPAAWVRGVIKNGGHRVTSGADKRDYVSRLIAKGISPESAEQIASRTV